MRLNYHYIQKQQVFVDLFVDYLKYGRRHIGSLTIAPNGSISCMAQTSSGIEPVFMLNYKRRKRANPDETPDFIDAAKWEEVKRGGDDAIKAWIKNQIDGTSVTVVLIGAQTSERRWVQYEIQESLKNGNGLLGVYIHNCPLFDRSTDQKGANPFDSLYYDRNGRRVYLSELYNTYDWVNDNGRENLGQWIEDAARAASK